MRRRASSPRRAGAIAALVALVEVGAAATACAPGPCTPGACGDEGTCVLGRCMPHARVPIGEDARRLVVFARDVAAVAEHLPGGGHAALPLGGHGAGDAALYLTFDLGDRLGADDAIQAAYVVAEPVAGASTASAWIEVEARDVPGRFDGAAVDWRRRPATDRPAAVGRTRGAAGSPLRVDVTDLVRRWARRGAREGRVALVARASADLGATVSTGLGAGPAPRLEVYLR
jgi:hypothetical protein